MKFEESGADRWVMSFSAKLEHLRGAGTLYRTTLLWFAVHCDNQTNCRLPAFG